MFADAAPGASGGKARFPGTAADRRPPKDVGGVMGTALFTTTKLRGLNAAGRTADLQHALIAAILERHLGTAFAGIFAEFEVRDSDTRDWFVDGSPVPINVADLPADYQAALRARCGDCVAAIRNLADKLETQGAHGNNVARVLRDATVFPAEDLWLYKGAPLIVNWGYYRADAQVAPIGVIAGEVRIADPAARRENPRSDAEAIDARKSRARKRWLPRLLWLVFIAIVAKLYAEFLPACGLQLPVPFARAIVGNCALNASADPAFAEGARLQREVEQAELDIAKLGQNCAVQRKRADGGGGRPSSPRRSTKQAVRMRARRLQKAIVGAMQFSDLRN